MSSSAALKVLFALAVIWASYETSIALENGISEQGSSTETADGTPAATTLVTTEDERQATTSLDATEESTTLDAITEGGITVSFSTSSSTSFSSPANGHPNLTSSDPSKEESSSRPAQQQLQGLLMPYDVSTEADIERNETKFDSKNNEEVYTEEMKALSPPTFSGYIYELDSSAETNLQDISGQESKVVSNLYLHFEPKKQKKRKQPVKQQSSPTVHITSYLADSDTAIPMTETEILTDARNKTRGADMISAFFIAPDDEVNEIDKTRYSGRPIVVSNLKNEDLVRNERYTGREATKTLTNDILAPIQAAVSLSHEGDSPTIEKQVLHKEPVYKTYIEIQKSIPYEIKEVEEPKEQPLNDLGFQIQNVEVHQNGDEIVQQQQVSNDLGQQQTVMGNELPVYNSRTPARAPVSFYYRYPMYYLPSSYIGNYIMRHSHENTGYNQLPVRPILPIQYMLARYQPHVYSTFLLTHPYYITPTDSSHQHQPIQHHLQQPQQQQQQLHVSQDPYEDQNGLQAEQRPQYVRQQPPFRSSHPVYSSQYPPYTYKVLSTMRSRNARTARSKQLCIEYGGFKPPMVPSVQLDEESLEPVKDKTDADEKSTES